MKQLLLTVSIALGACSSLVPGTILQLNDVDPLTADPAVIALRATLPDSVGVMPGSATLQLSARLRDGSERTGSFVIEQMGDVFQVSPEAHNALRALQADIAACKAADPDGTEGSLGIDLEPCRRGADIPADATLSVAVRLEAGGAFLPLVRDARVVDLLDNDTVDEMTRCP
ncbi:MAG: hypothetical protein AAF227_00555 [Pseudomonadota bacterium]